MKKEIKRIHFRLDKNLAEKFEKELKKTGRTKTAYLTLKIKEFVEAGKKELSRLEEER